LSQKRKEQLPENLAVALFVSLGVSVEVSIFWGVAGAKHATPQNMEFITAIPRDPSSLLPTHSSGSHPIHLPDVLARSGCYTV
jgi:hypothetical protein